MPIDLDIHTLKPEEFFKYKAVDIREPDECLDYPPLTKNITFIPLSQLEKKLDFFTTDHTYLLVCAKGGRSHNLAEYLGENGINALSVNNGMASFNKYLKDHGCA